MNIKSSNLYIFLTDLPAGADFFNCGGGCCSWSVLAIFDTAAVGVWFLNEGESLVLGNEIFRQEFTNKFRFGRIKTNFA